MGAAARGEAAAVKGAAMARRSCRTLAASVLTLAVMCGVWQGAIVAFHLSPFVAKGPVSVFRYLTSDPDAASNRSVLLQALLITARDAALGYVAGTLAAVGVSLAVTWRRTLAQTVMPVAVALRSVPLVAMVPVLSLVLGQGLASVAVIAGIVTFFPTLVNVAQGLRSAPAATYDLFSAYGASDWEVLHKARLPYALPSIFASARIAAPGALLGAVLAEWLSTGQGLGDLMVTSSSTANYSMLWSSVVAITVVSVLVYNAVAAVERPVIARLGSATAS